jgi:sesquipedalian
MESWMKAITCASYDYMKLMISELQRQLEEIDSRNKALKSESSEMPPKAPPRRQNPFNKTTTAGEDRVRK